MRHSSKPAMGGGYRGADLRRVAHLVAEHQGVLLRAWDEYFRD